MTDWALVTAWYPDTRIARVRDMAVAVAGEGQRGFCPRATLRNGVPGWLSTGPIEAQMLPVLQDPDVAFAALQAADFDVTLAELQAIRAECVLDPRTGDDLPALLAEHGMQYAPDPEA